MEATKAEKLYVPDVSGLWAHSHNAADDLMKRYIVWRKATGWLAIASFDTLEEAALYMSTFDGARFRITDEDADHGH